MVVEERDLAPDAVRQQLDRILAAPDFDTSERNRRFLAYVVEQALAGHADRIKAYTIATTVYGRDASFDPQLDSIVRIEAGRIRRSLERYYLTAGVKDPIRITLPRGCYVPTFEAVPPAGTQDATPAEGCVGSPRSPRRTILVAGFEEDGGPSPFVNFTRGFTRQTIVALTRFTDLVVIGPDAVARPDGGAVPASAPAELDVDFLLTGGATLTADSFAIEVMLMDARSRRYIWAEHFQRKLIPAEILNVRDELANSIARTLAQPHGIIFSNKAREAEGLPPQFLTSYDYVIRYFQYSRTYDRTAFESVRNGLERAVAMDPGYAEAFACLSQMYSDAFRFGFEVPDRDIVPLQRALALARRAIELAPNSSRAHHALGHAYWFDGDVGSALTAFEAGLALNPNDTDLMADLGLRYANLGDWQKALPLLEGAYARNPAQPGVYRVGLAQYHYVCGRYADALAEAQKINAPSVAWGFVMVAASAAQLGLAEVAVEALGKVLKLFPDFGDRIVTDLKARHVHPDTIEAVVDGLRTAGLTGREVSPIATPEQSLARDSGSPARRLRRHVGGA